MPVLEELTLENFKSYREQITIKMMQFSSIIGLNGAGKSCLVDAVKFAFCFSPYDKMPIDAFKNEVCHKDGTDNSRSTVKVKLNVDDKLTTIQRTVDYDEYSIKYFINDKEVDRKTFRELLLMFNINPRANNLFIEQNMVDNLIIMDPKERAVYFEQLCGSASFKAEYVRVLRNLKEIDTRKKNLQSEKNYFSNTKKALKNMSKETERHNELTDNLDKLEFQYYYAQLYLIDSNLERLLQEKNQTGKIISTTERLQKSTQAEIEKLQGAIQNKHEDLNIYEDKVRKRKVKVEEYLTDMLQLNQKLTVIKDKIGQLEANLTKAKKTDAAHERIVKDLECQLQQVEEDKLSFTKSQATTCSLELEDQKYVEYLRLKSEAQVKSAKEFQMLGSIERERESIKDKIEDCERQKYILFQKIEKQQKEIEDLNGQILKIKQNIQKSEVSEKCKQEKCQNLIEKSEALKNNIDILEDQVHVLNQQWIESKESAYESKIARKRQEVLNTLKSVFPGVEDRLKNICRVSEDGYQIAITKLMGKKMNAIVVDTKETASKCIEFLKKKYFGEKHSVMETFLPIDYVQIKPLEKALRMVKSTPNAKVAVFAMRSASKGVQKVLHHVLRDAIICETDNEALELSKKCQIDCVSLSGTLFRRNGIISGGLASLLEKSKEWSDKDREKLKNDKEKKITLLRKLTVELRSVQESLREIMLELSALNTTLEKHLIPLLKEKQEDLGKKKRELLILEKNFAAFDHEHKYEELQKELEAKNKMCEQIEFQKNQIEDAVFENFCASLQIPDIRVYEQGNFKKSQDRIDRQKEYDNLIDQIKNQINFENNRDTKTPIKKLESRIARDRKSFDDLNLEKEKLSALIEKRKSSIGDDQLILIKKDIDELHERLKTEKKKYKLMETDIKEYKSQVMANTARLLTLRAEKHELLRECKIKNLKIPLYDGTIDKILLKSGVDTTVRDGTDSSTTDETLEISLLKEKDVEINYAILPESVKNNTKKIVENLEDEMSDILKELNEKFEHINARTDLETVDLKLKKIQKDFNDNMEELSVMRKKFDQVKSARSSLFKEFLTALQAKVDTVFKEIFDNESAQAYIMMRNPDEPYLQGIDFSCIMPNKPMIPMENISGAEKAICALSLLIGIHQLKPSPCLIFDEVDAAIDGINQTNLYSYLERLKPFIQIMIISHQMSVNLYADAAINIRLHNINTSSALHVCLHEYLKNLSETTSKSTIDEKMLSVHKRIGNLSASTPVSRLPEISNSTSEKTGETD